MLKSTKQEIPNCEKNLKLSMKREAFNEIEKIIKTNEQATKLVLGRRKFKKFNYLKQNLRKKPIAIAEDNTEQQRKSYVSAVKRNDINKPPLQKQSKANLQTTLTIKGKLQAHHPT